MTPLTREFVRRCIGEAAIQANIHADCVIYLTRGEGSRVAKATMRHILRVTECTPGELAKAWGCEPSTVYQARLEGAAPMAVPTPSPSAPKPYDDFTIEHLRWAHGDERAGQIIAGNDPRTQSDIAAWNRLGRGQRGAA